MPGLENGTIKRMNTPTILLLFGGESSEHDVSVASARNVFAAINQDRFRVILCYIDTDGVWRIQESLHDDFDGSTGIEVVPALGRKCFMTTSHEDMQVDVILPILHGKNGEDGSVQGLAQLMHIPIVGCDVSASAIGMDKRASKDIAASHNIQVVPYSIHRAGEELPQFSDLEKSLGNPLFVKPSRAGSSVGVSKVSSDEELRRALRLAHQHDTVALIEKAVRARELEVAVLGTPPHHKVSGVGEIIPGEEFYSYDDKYAEGSSASAMLPANIPKSVSDQVKADAATIYEVLGCSGLSRIDFFMDEKGELYFNEINTLPGFTDISMYPKLWQHEGVGYAELIEILIEDALANATIRTT